MTDKFLEKIYTAGSESERQGIYDAWARSYDTELTENGYATPRRVAEALARFVGSEAPVLDFGCGTGLSGAALSAAGFATIDGCDISEGMLSEARAKGLYRRIWVSDPDAPLDVTPGEYAGISASGVVSEGAAPPETLDMLLACLAPGGHLAFSFNDHTLPVAAYSDKLAALTAQDGPAEQVFAEHGPHLPGIGLGAMVYVLRRT